MFLSIITPVYNTEKYLRECLDSCLQQGVGIDDYEIVLVDDGSTDDSGIILDEYAKKYANIIVIHKQNGGVSEARNTALDIVRGEYVWFIDSDDFIEKNILCDIFEIMRDKHPEIIQLNMYHMQSDYFTEEEEKKYKEGTLLAGKRLICSAIYRKDCIDNNKTRFYPELRSNGDLVFGYELKKSIGGYTNIAEYEPIVYYYRNNQQSITNTISSKKLTSFICLSGIMHKHATADRDGFGDYTMVRYLYRSYNGIVRLPSGERKKWFQLMHDKEVYPVVVGKVGCEYYRSHYKSMGIKGISKIMFRWIPTPIGYYYVWVRSVVSKSILAIRKIVQTKTK